MHVKRQQGQQPYYGSTSNSSSLLGCCLVAVMSVTWCLQVVLSHTPMRPLAAALGQQPVLVVGRHKVAVAASYGFSKVLTTRQLAAALGPGALPFLPRSSDSAGRQMDAGMVEGIEAYEAYSLSHTPSLNLSGGLVQIHAKLMHPCRRVISAVHTAASASKPMCSLLGASIALLWLMPYPGTLLGPCPAAAMCTASVCKKSRGGWLCAMLWCAKLCS
jgi:hypothetical protein